MTQMDKAKIEDLLSAYVDDELSPRERTEVKRLVRNDKKLADQLRRLEKQKELMLAMPVVSAPQGMVQDVKGAVERKALLGKAPETKQVRDGHRDLQARRMMATPRRWRNWRRSARYSFVPTRQWRSSTVR